MSFYALRLAVAKIIEHPHSYEWTLQGFGMLRLYLSRDVRLHVWSPQHAVEDVSVIHDHPWDFESLVLCGSIRDIVYREAIGVPTHSGQRIRCGAGGHADGVQSDVRLFVESDETFAPGQIYRRSTDQLHESIPEPGTVTVITRTFMADPDHAHVYFALNTEWVSAEPRLATREEVEQITSAALTLLRQPEPPKEQA